ncbi:MAG: hypothetical protein PHQ96_09280, partial [Candidatus Omnitrophica bacterium]|nr:hypothetical protein [Candidatus Omnitrophota bacterium]
MRAKSARLPVISVLIALGLSSLSLSCAATKEEKRKAEEQALQERFKWWPTDAKPAPVKDRQRGGYWWWPNAPGKVSPLWGNRGYCYVRKIIF